MHPPQYENMKSSPQCWCHAWLSLLELTIFFTISASLNHKYLHALHIFNNSTHNNKIHSKFVPRFAYYASKIVLHPMSTRNLHHWYRFFVWHGQWTYNFIFHHIITVNTFLSVSICHIFSVLPGCAGN